VTKQPEPNLDPSPNGGGVLLLRTWNDGEAMMIKQLLATYGIPCQVVSDVPHTVLPISVDGLGEVRILVPGERLEEAKRLIAEHLRQGLELLDGGNRMPDDAGDR
jgi:hypothetical protein